jgi:hypothetical protein
MEEIFKFETQVNKGLLKNVPKSVIERQIINRFINSLPIEKLKELVGFKCIDYNLEHARGDIELYHLLCRLRHEDVVLYKCKITI